MILCQSIQKAEGRFIRDAAFTTLLLLFFAIGMSMRRRILSERQNATCRTTAIVISTGEKKQTGKRLFFPEYEFQKDGQLYHITSQTDYSVCYVTQGKQVDLCYAPDAPTTFYVPLMQRHDNRLAGLLCGVGILWPLFGLFAPLIRTIFSFLYETP